MNLSLEADGGSVAVAPGQSLAVGVDYAWNHGAIAVVAAGNATPSLFGATGYAGVNAVIVGATGPSNEVAWYSSPLDRGLDGGSAPREATAAMPMGRPAARAPSPPGAW